jgi:FMN phosphatase YigB (HAD superfamily)
MFKGKTALLLDMNGTFMFGEDRFDAGQDFSVHYREIGGRLPRDEINHIIHAVYGYLDKRYPDPAYRHNFPAVDDAVAALVERALPQEEVARIVATFACHELGHIPPAYVAALHKLRERFVLSLVIDIWSPKAAWLETFNTTAIDGLFSAASFSSGHGMVKPSPRPFERVLETLGMPKAQALVVGDSVRRDLGGAQAAGLDCVLVGGKRHPRAVACFENLLAMSEAI